MKIKIYQIVPEKDTMNLMFRGLDFIQDKCAGRIPSECYACIYTGEIQAETLEDIFTIFNIRHPAGYLGRSLSMSDVVEVVSGDVESAFYYCDRFGFSKIPLVLVYKCGHEKLNNL